MAKIRPEQLSRQIEKKLSPIYVISGDEILLIQEACDVIRSKAKKLGFTDRELYNVEAQFNWDNFLQSANSLSLFSEKKILEIRIQNGKPGDVGSKALIEYCQAPSPDNILLLILPKMDRRSQNTKWFKTLEANGDIVIIWPIGTQQLPQWIEQRLQQHGIKANSQAIDVLCTKTEGNLLAAAQEIEKLKLLNTDTILDAPAMTAAVMSSARYNVFGLIDKALLGQAEQSIATLKGLKGEGSEPNTILWAISKEIRTLAHIKEAIDAGKSFDFAAKQQGVWENRKQLIRQASQRLSTRQTHTLLRKSSQVDKTIKGIEKGDVWNLLLDLILSLSGVETFSARTQKMALTI